jgi:acyl transferase domain-containing protein
LEDCPSVIKHYFNNEGATLAAFESGRFRTGDIFRRGQPTKSDKVEGVWWQSVGRIDDLIVHENGEKTNPIPLEISIEKFGWNMVSKAVLFGSGRPFCVAVIHLTSVGILDDKTFNEVWKAIEQANVSASDYSRVTRSAVILLHNRIPLPLSPKGSLVRKQLGIMILPLLDWIFGVGDKNDSHTTSLLLALNALEPQLKNSVFLLGLDKAVAFNVSKKNSPADRLTATTKLVASLIASELAGSSSEQVQLERDLMLKHRKLAFHKLGIDSTKAIVIRNKLARAFEIPLSGTVLFDHPTLDSVVEFLIGGNSSFFSIDNSSPIRDFEEEIAVVGMSCRFAGINNVEEYWKALLDCKDLRRPLSTKRKADYSRGASGDVEEIEKGYFMEDIDLFDAEFFNISAAEAKRMNPQQRILLETCWELLETSGETKISAFSGATNKRPRVGVFIGRIWAEYSSLKEEDEPHTPFDTLGSGGGSAAGRISHVFGFNGPSIVIDTACSSSLMAVHLACKSLRDGECDFAIAGGVNLILTSESWRMTTASGMTAPSGICKTFDADADGMARGEGCGLVLLRRGGDLGSSPYLGMIKGSYANNNGDTSIGMHAPSKTAQIDLAQYACKLSGVSPSEVSFIEAHGTGTRIGDPIEIQALAEVYLGSDEINSRQSPLYVTSVKSNIGHTESAAGVAGLIKTLLCLQHHTVPKQLHLETLNPLLELEKYRPGDLVIPTTEVSFDSLLTPSTPRNPLVAAVSSFGLIGTNVHLILEEARPNIRSPRSSSCSWSILTLSAKSKASLESLMIVMKKKWEDTDPTDLSDLCFTTNHERSHFACRFSFAISSSNYSWPTEVLDWQKNDIRTTPTNVFFLFDGDHLLDCDPTFPSSFLRSESTYQKLIASEPIATILQRSNHRLSFFTTFLGIYLSARMWLAWGVNPTTILASGVGVLVSHCIQDLIPLSVALRVISRLDELRELLLGFEGFESTSWASFTQTYEKAKTVTQVTKWTNAFNKYLLKASTTSFGLPDYLTLRNDDLRLETQRATTTSESPVIVLDFKKEKLVEASQPSPSPLPGLLFKNNNSQDFGEVISRLYIAGVDINFGVLHSGQSYHKMLLPTYRFDRKSFWIYDPSSHEPSYGYQQQEKKTGASTSDNYEEIKVTLISIIGELLGLRVDSTEDISSRSVFSLGVNSLMVPVFQEAVFDRLGRTIETGDLYSKSSIAELAAFLLDHTAKTTQSRVEQTTAPRRTDRINDPVVIASVAFRFPGDINDADSFWNLLRSGESGVTRQPQDPKHPLYKDILESRCPPFGGFLSNIQKFDAHFFECSPKEAHAMDPSQRLMLELAWETLERGGICPTALEGSNTGVYIGTSLTSEYPTLRNEKQAGGPVGSYDATGVAASMISGRISHFLKLSGPSLTLDTACSSSLVAFHLACESLLSGECNLALAGGANLMLSPITTMGYSEAGLLSPDGNCCPFGSNANGIVRSEGLAMILLMKQSTALANGHSILGTVLSSAVNNNGGGSSITVPNRGAQEQLMRTTLARVQRHGKRKTASVQFVEAHGTGTKLGDPIEIQALVAVYSTSGAEETQREPLRIGSVKANLGHTEAAAGLAGLIKVLLCFQHEAIPKQINLWKLNDSIDAKKHNLEIPMDLTEWKRTAERPRVAAVSSFGISGTNAHSILQEPPQINEVISLGSSQQVDWNLLTISAKTESGLSDLLVRYHHYLTELNKLPAVQRKSKLVSACFTSNVGRAHFHHRTAVLVNPSVDNLADLLTLDTTVIHGVSSSSTAVGERPKWGALFNDFYGEQSMEDLELFTGHPVEAVYRTELNSCHARMGDVTSKKPPPSVGAFVKSFSAFQTMTSLLSPPSIVFGAGQGEILAAATAGIIPLAHALRILLSLEDLLSVWERTQELLPLTTLIVFGSFDELTESGVFSRSGTDSTFVVVSEYNERWFAICGSPASLEAIQRCLKEKGVTTKEGFDSRRTGIRSFGWEAIIYLFNRRKSTVSLLFNKTFEEWDKTVAHGCLQPVARRFMSSSLRKVVDRYVKVVPFLSLIPFFLIFYTILFPFTSST